MNNITGDKLTAFAPNTTGIPYLKGKDSMSMEIIKQMFDIGHLFDRVTDIEAVSCSFSRFVKTELRYKEKKSLSGKDVLEDIIQTSLCLATRGIDGMGDIARLQQGIQRVTSFIFSESYHIEKAITHASKTAYLAVLIQNNERIIERYRDPFEMKDWLINKPLNTKLNKLKKSNPEAFFYWYKISELCK